MYLLKMPKVGLSLMTSYMFTLIVSDVFFSICKMKLIFVMLIIEI